VIVRFLTSWPEVRVRTHLRSDALR